MPGLLRGIARTTVIAGTATAVSNRVSRRQYNKWAAQDEQQYQEQQQYQAPAPAPTAPAPAASSTDDKIDQLKQLADLKSQGILTDQEFASEKAKILGG
ncbi:MAG: SHOCT domain-containing protein [Solirubrobacterales bacterium]|nr:SHOCT domain-containing protein [Solirubrobacterales bacterium]